MTKQRLTVWTIAALLLLSGLHLGCSGADGAEDSEAEQTEKADQAEPASSEGGGDEAEDGEKEETDGEEGEDEDKEEAVPVLVSEVKRGEIESVLRFSSNLEAESQVKVVSQAKRLVTELLVEEGDTVANGELLLRLQDDEQRSALAKVTSQLAKAEREYVQQQRLFEQELISEQVYNDATYELDQLKISLDDAKRELGYTEVRAPIAGTITARMINLGDQVQIGQELFEIVDFDSIVARVFVPEKHLSELRAGLTARLSSQSSGDAIAEVKRISPIVDPRSGTVKVTIDVGRQAGMRPGMYVDVDLVTAVHSEAILIPKRALVYDDDQMFVYRLGEERRVERIFVEPRLTDKDFVEPSEGLVLGDQVVVAGQAGLKDGALIRLPGDIDEDTSEALTDDEPQSDQTQRASL